MQRGQHDISALNVESIGDVGEHVLPVQPSHGPVAGSEIRLGFFPEYQADISTVDILPQFNAGAFKIIGALNYRTKFIKRAVFTSGAG